MEVSKFGDYSLHFFEMKWVLERPTGRLELKEGLENYLQFFPILEADPKQLMEKVDSIEKGYPNGGRFAIESILKFVLKHDASYWLKLSLNWLDFVPMSSELIFAIKSNVGKISNKQFREKLFRHLINWNRIKANELYQTMLSAKIENRKEMFIDLLNYNKIDYTELDLNTLLINGVKFKIV